MSKFDQNVHVYADQSYAVWTAPLGTSAPTGLGTPASYFEVGLLSDNGMTEAHSFNENKIYDMSGALIRVARNQEERPWTFEAAEWNATVAGLLYPGSTVSTTGATAEVQTVAISGTPAGGTFNLVLQGFGAATNLAYNVATATLATALSNAFGMTITVTGTAGSSYVVTFPQSEGNVPTMTAASSLTGGTTPAITVTVTTSGVQGLNTRGVGSGIQRNLRQWVIDLADSGVRKRVVMNNGEATQSGTVTYNGSGAAVYQFTLNPYLDSNGNFYTVIDNDPAVGATFA